MTDPIRDWAREYSGEVGELPPAYRPAAQRARLLFAHRGERKPPRVLKAAYALLAAACCLGGVLLWSGGAAEEMEQRTSAEALPLLNSVALPVGQPIVANAKPQEIAFSGGTRALFHPGSSGKFLKASAVAVELTLDSGSLYMDVERQEGRTWIVRSGSFRIYVIGTAFTVSREASSQDFRVRVKRGKVRVEGPDIHGPPLILGAGEVFAWEADAAPHTDDGPSKLPPGEESLKTSDPSAPPSSAPSGKSSGTDPQPKSARTESWQALARSGKYELAIEQVERAGAEQVLASASADERLLLGNAARYSGRIELGSRAYLAAREAGGAAAPLAAYYLAKIALDSNGDQAGAIRWLQAYLREAPGGDLAVSARARLMNLLEATGRHAEARQAATEYLTLHPAGPNAETARKLLLRR